MHGINSRPTLLRLRAVCAATARLLLCLVREKVFAKKSESDVVDGVTTAKSPAEEQQIAKEMSELSKMRDSGTAAIVLRDLRKKRSESPTLDPRNASRTPSAAMEPSHKPRYKTPYFACMSDGLILATALGTAVDPGMGRPVALSPH